MSITPPAPIGPTPSARQLAWHEMEYYGFLHFTVNTFSDLEWGLGNESPALFQPRRFSANQIVESASMAGMKGLILTAKHHDGFCLWPSDHTNHSVKSSPWRNGKADVVGEIARACADHHIKFGVYLSPWDRNHLEYGRPGYVHYYQQQLRELLTRYGPLFEVWFDGANGGNGYYGGVLEERRIDAHTYYRWDEIFGIVRELQPQAVIFGGEPGSDIRWVGNEDGIAGDPCWHTFEAGKGEDAGRETLNRGVQDGQVWFPAECDVSIRPGWFYHARENRAVRSPGNLLDLYFQSVGRGANLLLNLPPNRDGQISVPDVNSIYGFRQIRERIFANDLAHTARASASSARPGNGNYQARCVIDNRPDTCWCAEDGAAAPELILDFPKLTRVNLALLREHLPLGQRVETFALDAWQAGKWIELTRAISIGSKRLVRFPAVNTQRIRLRILSSKGCPAIQEMGLFCFEENQSR